MSAPYDEDLAYIQAAGFGGMASAVAPQIVAMLRSRGIAGGTIGDIGCGAGVTTRHFLDAGYDVWALEPSLSLLEIARGRAQQARFLPPASVYESQLPQADALIAIGEPLNYHPPNRDAEARLGGFFVQAATALRPGGLLIFDVIVRGEPSLSARNWTAGDDWAVLAETIEDSTGGWLRREIQTFRRIGNGYRRRYETHHVRIFDPDALSAALLRAGFDVRSAITYGTYALAPRRVAFFCERI